MLFRKLSDQPCGDLPISQVDKVVADAQAGYSQEEAEGSTDLIFISGFFWLSGKRDKLVIYPCHDPGKVV